MLRYNFRGNAGTEFFLRNFASSAALVPVRPIRHTINNYVIRKLESSVHTPSVCPGHSSQSYVEAHRWVPVVTTNQLKDVMILLVRWGVQFFCAALRSR